MKSIIRFLCLLALIFTSDGYAQKTLKVSATVELNGYCKKGDKPSRSSVSKNALKKAKSLLIKTYSAEFNPSKAKSFYEQEENILSNVDQYILSTTVVEQICDESARTFTLVLRGDINESAISRLIQNSTESSSVNRAQKSYIATMFVAREVLSQKEYDEKVVKISEKKSSVESNEVIDVNGSGANITSLTSSSQVDVNGGSKALKADKLEYSVSSPSDLNSAISKVFTQGGFRPVPGFAIQSRSGGQFSIDAMTQDFGQSNEISPTNLDQASMALQGLRVPYFAVGTLDIGMKRNDPVTGNVQVYVSVSAKVYKLDGFFPEEVASVGPVQFSGLGPDQSVARRNALINAGNTAAQEIVDTLNAAGIY